MTRLGFSIWFILMTGSLVFAQSKEELQRQKQKAFDDIKIARELMEETAAQRSSSVQQLRILQRGINSRARVISTLESEVNLYSRNILDTEDRIEFLEAENEKNKEEYARLIYYAYRNHTDYEKLMYILAGSSISQSYQRYKYLKYLSEYRERKAREIEATMNDGVVGGLHGSDQHIAVYFIAQIQFKRQFINGFFNQAKISYF